MSEIIKFFDDNGSPLYIKNYGAFSTNALSMDNGRYCIDDFIRTIYLPLLQKIFGNDFEIKFVDKVKDTSYQMEYWYCCQKPNWGDNYFCIVTSNNTSSVSVLNYQNIYKYTDIETTEKTKITTVNCSIPLIKYNNYSKTYKDENNVSHTEYYLTIWISSNAYMNVISNTEGAISPRESSKGFIYVKNDEIISAYSSTSNPNVYMVDMTNGELKDVSGVLVLVSRIANGNKNITTQNDVAFVTDIFIHNQGLLERYFDSDYLKCVVSNAFTPTNWVDYSILINGHHYHQLYYNYFIKED